MESRVPVTAAAVAAVAAVAGGAFLWWRASSQRESADKGPLMTEKEVVEFFKAMNGSLARVANQLMQNVKSLSSQIPDPAQIQQILVAEYEKHVAQRQTQLLKELKADEEDLEQATSYWLDKGSADLKRQVTVFKELYSKMGGMVEEELPEDLTVEKFCDVLEDYFNAVYAGQQLVMMEVQKHGGNPPPAVQEQLQAVAQKMQTDALSKHSMSLSTFQSGVKTFQSNPKFQAKIQEMEQQAKTRQKMSQAIGAM